MSNQDAIYEFADKVRWLHEPEFGDFKRKVTLYINRLAMSLSQDPQALRVLQNMRDEVLYHSPGDVEAARAQLLLMVQNLRRQ